MLGFGKSKDRAVHRSLESYAWMVYTNLTYLVYVYYKIVIDFDLHGSCVVLLRFYCVFDLISCMLGGVSYIVYFFMCLT
jgi:hypothetical protein